MKNLTPPIPEIFPNCRYARRRNFKMLHWFSSFELEIETPKNKDCKKKKKMKRDEKHTKFF